MLNKIISVCAILLLSATCMAHSEWQNLELSAQHLSTLRISAADIPLVVTGSSGDRLQAELVVNFPAWPEKATRLYLDKNLTFSLTAEGDIATLLVTLYPNGPDLLSLFTGEGSAMRGLPKLHPEMKLKVSVPNSMAVSISKDDSSLVVIQLKGALDISQGSGSVSLFEVTGAVSVNLGSGDLALSGGQGSGRLVSGSATIDVQDTKGEYYIDNGGGSLTVTAFTGSLSINNGSGNLRVARVNGPLQIFDSLGEISIHDVQGEVSMAAGGGKGSISLNNISNAANMTIGRKGPIAIDQVGGNLSLTRVGRKGRREPVVISNVEKDVIMKGVDSKSVEISKVTGEIVYL